MTASHPPVIAAGRLALALTAVSVVMAPEPAAAQAVFSVSPSVATTQIYDSNLFWSSTDRQTDLITRVTPGVLSTYRSPLFSLVAKYSFDVERFANHDHLSSGSARRHAAAELDYRPSRTFAIVTGADVFTTRTPAELMATTGLSLTRASASRVSGYSTLTRRTSPLTVATAEYRVSEDRITGGTRVRQHTASARAEHQASQRDSVSATYRLQQFAFDISSATSHALNLGWTRGLTSRTAVSMQGGPNLTSGSTALDLAITVRNRAGNGERTLTYARGQTTVIGLAGVVNAQSLSAHVPWGSPRSLTITVVPAFYRNEQARRRADVLRLSLSAARPVTRRFSLEATVGTSVQHGDLYTARARQTIPRHEVLLRLTAGIPAPPR